MSDKPQYKLHFLGWYNDPSKNSDKVWGYVEVGGQLYNFWGRRGKAFTFKRHGSDRWAEWELEDKARAKRNKGYRMIPLTIANGLYDAVERVCKDFDAEFRSQLMMAKLSDNFHGER